MSRLTHATSLAAALVLTAALAWAQAAVTTADLDRLQDRLMAANRDVAALAETSPARASSLRDELDAAGDEIIYLKVKLRKNEPVTRQDYSELRDRIDDIRTRALAPSPAAPTRTAPTRSTSGGTGAAAAPRQATVPVGTQLDVRLQDTLSSETARVNQPVEATTVADLQNDAGVLIPAGSLVRGVVSNVHAATRTERTGSLTIDFNEITVNGTTQTIRATVTPLESEGIKAESGRIATGAGVGAIIGGILGGVKGALAGILIGGGGTIAATEGEDVRLPAGTILRLQFDSPLQLSIG
jgi:hypothetical protein